MLQAGQRDLLSVTQRQSIDFTSAQVSVHSDKANNTGNVGKKIKEDKVLQQKKIRAVIQSKYTAFLMSDGGNFEDEGLVDTCLEQSQRNVQAEFLILSLAEKNPPELMYFSV